MTQKRAMGFFYTLNRQTIGRGAAFRILSSKRQDYTTAGGLAPSFERQHAHIERIERQHTPRRFKALIFL